MVLLYLDFSFCYVAVMVVWGVQVVGHGGVFDFLFMCLIYVVVQDLVHLYDALNRHLYEDGSACPDHFSLRLVFHEFDQVELPSSSWMIVW